MPRLYSLSTRSLLSPALSGKKDTLSFEYISNGVYQFILENNAAYSPDHSIIVITGFSSIQTTVDGRELTPRKVEGWTPTESLDSWSDVVYAQGVGFLAVGYARIAFSSNGVDWVNRTAPVTSNIIGCTFANGIFIIVGSLGNMFKSSDTITWTKIETGNTTTQIWSVAWNGSRWQTSGNLSLTSTSPTADSGTWTSNAAVPNCWKIKASPTTNRFVAAGNSGVIFVSDTSGTTWTSYTSPIGTNSLYTDISFATISGTEYVIIVGDGPSNNGSIIYSTSSSNFSTWTAVDTSSTPKDLGGIIWNGAEFLAFGDQGHVLASSNATSWTERRYGVDIRTIDYSPVLGKYAVGTYVGTNNGELTTSSDLYKWTFGTYNSSVKNQVRWLEGYFYAVGEAGFSFMRSNNGTNWQVLPQVGGGSQNLNSVTYGDGWYVVVGDNGKIFYSATPTVSASWKTATLSNGAGANINSVIYNSTTQEWVAVGNGGTFHRGIKGLRYVLTPSSGWPSSSGNYYTNSTDGTSIVVGVNDYVNGTTGTGRFYVYRNSDFTNTAIVLNPNASDSNFGKSVSVFGSYIAVGVTQNTPAGYKAYLYNIDGSLYRTLTAPAGATNAFGDKIELSANYCVVADREWIGANFKREGRVHIYRVSDGQLLFTVNNPDPTGFDHEEFGWDIDLSGNNLVVGTYLGRYPGRAYIFNVTTGALLFTLQKPVTSFGYFGATVAINDTVCVVGDPSHRYVESVGGSGIVYIFNVSNGGLIATLTNPNNYGTQQNDSFGRFIAASNNYITIGTYSEQDIYGTFASGVVYVYSTSGNLVRTIQNPNIYGSGTYDLFGGVLSAISNGLDISGNVCIISAPYEDNDINSIPGRLYIFDLSDGPAYWFSEFAGSNDDLYSVDYSHNVELSQSRYLAVGNGGRWSSLNPSNNSWTTSVVSSGKDLNEVRWDLNRKKFIAVGNNRTIYEIDSLGQTWTKIELKNDPGNIPGGFDSIAISTYKNRYVLAGPNNLLATSPIYDEYQIGDFVAGGYYAGNIVINDIAYALILAPKSSGESTSNLTIQSARASAWPSGTLTLNNGAAASAALAGVSSAAAQFCENLSIDGYMDWYLPSRDELEICYRAFKPTTDANYVTNRNYDGTVFSEGYTGSSKNGVNANSRPAGLAYVVSQPTQTANPLFKEGGSEAFLPTTPYWSSTQYGTFQPDMGVGQTFNTGQQFNTFKDTAYKVRAVRKAPLSALIVNSTPPRGFFYASGNNIQRSVDGCSTWTTWSTYPSSSGRMNYLFCNKTNSQLWYGAAEGAGFSNGNFLYVSNNAGQSWTIVDIGASARWDSGLAVGNVIMVASDNGLCQISTDGGVSWINGKNQYFGGLEFGPKPVLGYISETQMFVVGTTTGLWTSQNAIQWTKMLTTYLAASTAQSKFVKSGSRYILLGTNTEYVYTSDYGTTWTSVARAASSSRGGGVIGNYIITVDYLGGNHTQGARSSDGGLTFSNYTLPANLNWWFATDDGNYIIVSDIGGTGLWRTTNPDLGWTAVTVNLGYGTQLWSFK